MHAVPHRWHIETRHACNSAASNELNQQVELGVGAQQQTHSALCQAAALTWPRERASRLQPRRVRLVQYSADGQRDLASAQLSRHLHSLPPKRTSTPSHSTELRVALQQQQTQRDPVENPSRPGATGTTAAGTAPDDPAVVASMSKGPATPEGTQVLRLLRLQWFTSGLQCWFQTRVLAKMLATAIWPPRRPICSPATPTPSPWRRTCSPRRPDSAATAARFRRRGGKFRRRGGEFRRRGGLSSAVAALLHHDPAYGLRLRVPGCAQFFLTIVHFLRLHTYQ